MRAVLQRVQHAEVRIVGCDIIAADGGTAGRADETKVGGADGGTVDGANETRVGGTDGGTAGGGDETKKRQIGQGFLILLGVCEEDTMEDVDWLVKKVANLRVFDDDNHVMNRSILDIQGEALVVSQFTLYASYKKGNRPSWFKAGSHDHSIPLYEAFCRKLSEQLAKPVGTGVFGADMKVELVNDGPVTICMDTKNKE